MKGYFLILLFFGQFCFGQSGFNIPGGERKITIPFQFINNLIFINVEVNGVPLTFLLDTGVSKTLLLSLGNKDVDFKNSEKIKFSGLGGDTDIEGLKSRNNKVKINDQYIDFFHTVYIILNEEFNFSSYIGIPVHGIMGYDFFKNYPVEIDFITKKITIYNQDKYYKRKTKNFEEIPLTIENAKPYLIADVELSTKKKPSKLLVDIGNSDAVWLFPEVVKDAFKNKPTIEDFLGRGFNGDILGKRGRIHQLFLGDFSFAKPIIAIPDERSIQHVQFAKDREGSIGSEIMRRFTVIFDYPHSKILLKKNRDFDDDFRFNMSGMEFKHIGSKFEKEYVKMVQPLLADKTSGENTVGFADFQYKLVLKPVYAIASIRKDSPADLAGLQKDDVLESIDGKSTAFMSLPDLNEMMRHNEGKSFKIEISRKEIPLKFTFTLQDPIPYKE